MGKAAPKRVLPAPPNRPHPAAAPIFSPVPGAPPGAGAQQQAPGTAAPRLPAPGARPRARPGSCPQLPWLLPPPSVAERRGSSRPSRARSWRARTRGDAPGLSSPAPRAPTPGCPERTGRPRCLLVTAAPGRVHQGNGGRNVIYFTWEDNLRPRRAAALAAPLLLMDALPFPRAEQREKEACGWLPASPAPAPHVVKCSSLAPLVTICCSPVLTNEETFCCTFPPRPNASLAWRRWQSRAGRLLAGRDEQPASPAAAPRPVLVPLLLEFTVDGAQKELLGAPFPRTCPSRGWGTVGAQGQPFSPGCLP